MYASAHVCVCVCVCVCMHAWCMNVHMSVYCVCVCVCCALCCSMHRAKEHYVKIPYFFNQMLRLLFFFLLLIFGQLLFEGGVYFFGKLVGINHDWIRTIQWQLLDAVSSKCSLLVLLSVVETSRTTQAAQTVAYWPSFMYVCICCILAAAIIQGWCLFRSELPTV